MRPVLTEESSQHSCLTRISSTNRFCFVMMDFYILFMNIYQNQNRNTLIILTEMMCFTQIYNVYISPYSVFVVFQTTLNRNQKQSEALGGPGGDGGRLRSHHYCYTNTGMTNVSVKFTPLQTSMFVQCQFLLSWDMCSVPWCQPYILFSTLEFRKKSFRQS